MFLENFLMILTMRSTNLIMIYIFVEGKVKLKYTLR